MNMRTKVRVVSLIIATLVAFAAPQAEAGVVTMVSAYGAKGDNTANDLPAIMAAINATPEGGTVLFDSGKTYLTQDRILINKGITLDFSGSTLHNNTTNTTGHNDAIFVQSVFNDAPTASWTEAVVAGQSVLHVAVSPSGLPVGTDIKLDLGTDPYDGNEPNTVLLTKVLANDGTTVTIDQPVPHAIVQGTKNHAIRRITHLVNNVRVVNVKFDFTGETPDSAAWVDCARNVAIENFTGDVPGFIVSGSENVSLRHGYTHLIGPAYRLLAAYRSSNVRLEDCVAVTNQDTTPIFFESWLRSAFIDGFEFRSTKAQAVNSSAVFHVSGGASDVRVRNTTIRVVSPTSLATNGATPSDVTFESVDWEGPIDYLYFQGVHELRWNGVRYGPNIVTRLFTLDLSASGAFNKKIGSGMLVGLRTYLTDSTGFGYAVLNNNENHGTGATDIGVAGVWHRYDSAMFIHASPGAGGFQSPTGLGKDIEGVFTTAQPGRAMIVSASFLLPEGGNPEQASTSLPDVVTPDLNVTGTATLTEVRPPITPPAGMARQYLSAIDHKMHIKTSDGTDHALW